MIAATGGTQPGGYDRPVTTARYDGMADWYDEALAPSEAVTETVVRLVGPGPGACLDLCCGTGFHIRTLVELGWTVTGVDLSEDQLRLARERAGDGARLLLADAADLPFGDATFDLVFSAFSHTDVDDFGRVVGEARRVLKPGSPLVYVGVHPCFVGPHSEFVQARGIPVLHSGYAEAGRYTDGPGISPSGLRARVGAAHLPLGLLLGSFLDAGFKIERFEEPLDGDRGYPHWLALRARR